jgi:hypothetical protein
MGLLKKLQAENGDDGGEESILDETVTELPPDAVEGQSSEAKLVPPGRRHFYRAVKTDGRSRQQKDEITQKPQQQEATAGAGDGPGQKGDDIPEELYVLRDLLRTHNWAYAQSSDPAVNANGRVEWAIIESQLHCALAAGHVDVVHLLWDQYAPADHPGLANLLAGVQAEESSQSTFTLTDLPLRLDSDPEETLLPDPYLNFYDPNAEPGNVYEGNVYEHDATGTELAKTAPSPFTDPYTSPEWAESNRMGPEENDSPDADKKNKGKPGSLLEKALSMPFMAGSVVLNSLKAMGKSFYVKNRINGHEILGEQLEQQAATIERMTAEIKELGMGDLIDDMRATGSPAKDIINGMNEGGPHQHFGDRFDSLMTSPAFSEKYAQLQNELTNFSLNASRYAKNGVELNLNYSDVMDRSLEKISAATEGFVFKKDGKIEHLQELARQIGERIANFINNLVGRLSPQ